MTLKIKISGYISKYYNKLGLGGGKPVMQAA